MTVVARFCSLLVISIVLPTLALSETTRVPETYGSIQDAIEACSDGDTVLVGPGTYVESLNYGGRLITVKSSDGPTRTTITNDSSVTLVVFNHGEDNRAVIEGFTLRGGWMGVQCENSGPTIRGNILVGQNVTTWCAIGLAGPGYPPGASYGAAPAVIVNNVITNCTNGGISSFSTEAPVIRNNIITFNGGIGIHCQHNELNVDIAYNNVYGNQSDYINIVWAGPGAISADPLFNEDYSLQGGSPCIGAGDSSLSDWSRGSDDIGAVPYGQDVHPVPSGINFGSKSVSATLTGASPTIHWSYLDDAGTSQAAYEIQVGTDLNWDTSELWATGPVVSGDSTADYEGVALEDGGRYYVRIRVSDGARWGDWQTHLLEVRSRVLVGGVHNNPPFGFVEGDGSPAGFNVELAHAVAEAMGIDIEVRLGSKDSIWTWLREGVIDAAVGMSYSVQRDRHFDFSAPFGEIRHSVFCRVEHSMVSAVDELRDLEIILVKGDIMHDYVIEHGLTDKLVLVGTYDEALELLASGTYEYAMMGRLVGTQRMEALGLSEKLKVGPLVQSTRLCFAVAEGDTGRLHPFSEGLAIVKGSGRYKELYDKWLGVLEPHSLSFGLIMKYVGIALLPVLIVLGTVLFWNWSLKRTVHTRTAELNTELAERKRAEEALKQSERRYRTLQDNVPVGLFRGTPDGRLKSANRALVQMMGYGSEEELLTVPVFQQVQDPEKIMESMIRLKQYGSIEDDEGQLRRKDGTLFSVSVSMRAVFDSEGELAFLDGSVVDITERKKAEDEARAANLEKIEQAKRISGTFAHEIRNALFPATAALNRLKSAALDGAEMSKSSREYLDIASSAVTNATGTTRLISSYNKLDTEVMPERVNLSNLANEFMMVNSARLNDAGVKIGLDGEMDIWVRSNRQQLPLVLNNLLANSLHAVKNTDSPRIDIRWSEDDGYLDMSFEDNGCGMDRDLADRVFEPFFSTRPDSGGIGIGLSTSKKIIEMYGGSISVTSTEGKGTRFDLRMELFSGDSRNT